MKKSGLSFICGGLIMMTTVALAGGPYEVGRMNIDGNTCVWTSYIKQDCTREEMQQKVAEMQACLNPQFDAGMEDCPSSACVRERIRTIAMDCCHETGGDMK